jgi:hypothetical protein
MQALEVLLGHASAFVMRFWDLVDLNAVSNQASALKRCTCEVGRIYSKCNVCPLAFFGISQSRLNVTPVQWGVFRVPF